MKRQYYVLFTCDEWKSYASMSLVGVFTLTKLRKVVKRRIKKGDFEYGRDIKEIDEIDGNEIDKLLTYGFIQSIELNEEQ